VADRAALVKALVSALGAHTNPTEIARELDRASIHLLYALAWHAGEEVTTADLQAAFPPDMPAEDVDAVGFQLALTGLLLPLGQGRYYLPKIVPQSFRSQGESLRWRLEHLPFDQLQIMVGSLGLQLAARDRSADMIDGLYAALSQAATVHRAVAELDANARHTLDLVVRYGRPISVQHLIDQLPPELHAALNAGWRWRGAAGRHEPTPNPLVALQRLGLAYVPLETMSYLPSLTVPEEIARHLRKPGEASWYIVPPLLPPVSEAPFVAHRALLPDMVRALTYLEQERPAVLKGGGFPKQAWKRLGKRLSVTEEAYAAFLVAMLLDLGLAGTGAGYFLPAPEADEWLRREAAAQARSVAQRWSLSLRWDEAEEECFRFNRYLGPMTDLRLLLPPLFARVPSAGVTLVSLRELLEFIRPVLVADVASARDWPGVFRRVLRSLHWLGLVEMAEGAEPAFRPGRYLPTLEEDVPWPVETGFVVQPNREIVALPDIALPQLRQLLRFAEGPAADGAIVLQITVASLRRGLECGLTGDSILAFLRAHASKGVPQTVEHFVRETAAQYGNLEVGPAEAYVKVANAELMQRMLSLRALRSLLKPLSDTVALLPKAHQAKVVTLLRDAGFLPNVLDDIPRVSPKASARQGPGPGRGPRFDPDWVELEADMEDAYA